MIYIEKIHSLRKKSFLANCHSTCCSHLQCAFKVYLYSLQYFRVITSRSSLWCAAWTKHSTPEFPWLQVCVFADTKLFSRSCFVANASRKFTQMRAACVARYLSCLDFNTHTYIYLCSCRLCLNSLLSLSICRL